MVLTLSPGTEEVLNKFCQKNEEKVGWKYPQYSSIYTSLYTWDKSLQFCLTVFNCMDSSPLPMGFSKQEYWYEFPFPPPGYLPDPGSEPTSLISTALTGEFFTVNAIWRSSQSILKEICPGCSLEGLMLKLKLQYSGHLMQRAYSFEKTLMLGKTEGLRRRGRRE